MSSQNHKIKLSVEGEAKLAGMKAEVSKTFDSLEKYARRATAILAGLGAAGGGGLTVLMNRQIDAARAARNWADSLSVPIERLTAMQAAAKTANIESEKFADILKDTSEKIADAYRNNGGEAVEVLESLGLNIEHINSLSPDQQLFAIADALGQVGTQGEKIQIMEALASDASRLLPLLDDNAAGMRELMRQADATGRTLNDIEAQKLLEAGEATMQLEQAMDGLGQSLAVSVSGPLSKIIRQISEGIPIAVNALHDAVTTSDREALAAATKHLRQLRETRDEYQRIVEQTEEAFPAGSVVIRERADSLREVEEKLAAARIEVERLQAAMEKPMTIEVTPGGVDDTGMNDRMGEAERDRLAASVEAFRRSVMDKRELLIEQHFDELELLDEAEARKIEVETSYDQLRLEAASRLNQQLTELDRQGAQDREKLEADVQSRIAGMRQSVAGLAVGLLRTLGQDHKEWAYASIAIEKALNIAMAIQNTAVAVTKAMAVDPTGVLAARAQSIGSFQVGLIAATGLAEAAGVSGGGGLSAGGAPTPVQPVEPGGATPLLPSAEQRQGSQITVIVEGNLFANDDAREWLVETLQEAQANDEIHLVMN